MMSEKVQNIIDEAVNNMTVYTGSDVNIKKNDKFIKELLSVIISKNDKYEIIEKYSDNGSNKIKISTANEHLIDSYITRCQTEDVFLDVEFMRLIKKIIEDKDENFRYFKNDIDLLFKDKETGTYYYLEVKYNDDYDTEKLVDINRRFIKTSAYLIKDLNITSIEHFKPILFFFNNKKMSGNIYIPESTNIYRGKKFFDEFLDIDYDEVMKYIDSIIV